jgi:hypothetical protein
VEIALKGVLLDTTVRAPTAGKYGAVQEQGGRLRVWIRGEAPGSQLPMGPYYHAQMEMVPHGGPFQPKAIIIVKSYQKKTGVSP